jgi:hypothetical protein
MVIKHFGIEIRIVSVETAYEPTRCNRATEEKNLSHMMILGKHLVYNRKYTYISFIIGISLF